MKVLLSGATGLIGEAVGEKLHRDGHHIVVLTRNPDKAKSKLKFTCEVRLWENESTPPKFDDGDNFDAVIHLAGEPIAEKRWTAAEKEKIRDSRVLGTRTLSQALVKQNLKVWVQGSAIGFYGDAGANWLNELTPPGHDFLAKVVHDWESEIERFARHKDFNLVVIRTGIVLATRGGALAKLYPIFKFGLGSRLGNGQQYFSWIHINDIAEMFCWPLRDLSVRGIVNGTAPQPVTNKEFTSKFAKALHRPEFLPIPKIFLRVALGEMSEALLASARVKTRAPNLGFKFEYENFDSAIADLSQRFQNK